MFHFESFRAVRWLRTCNLILQALLITTLFLGLKYLARHYAWRFDLTHYHRYSLSPETRSYLRGLTRPVRVVVTLSDDAPQEEVAQALRDVRSLLREYTYASASNDAGHRITVEQLDVFQRNREAQQLGIEQPNAIVFLSGDQKRVVTLGDLYHIEGGEKREFRGEQAFTSAILDVAAAERKKIYFLVGHGELDPDSVDPVRGLSALRDELRLRNFAVEKLDVGHLRKIPDDAALIVVAAPLNVDRFAAEHLRQYLSARAGRAILLLAPRLPHGLDDLLADWGVMVDDDVIYDINPESVTEEGDLRISAFQKHPITQMLIDRQLALRLGETRSLRPEPGRGTGGGLTLTTLGATSPTAWGERSYRLRQMPEYDPGIDVRGLPRLDPANRLGIGVASERVQARGDLPFSVRGGRLVVFGSADLASNSRLGFPGNQTLFFNAINWTVDRDTQLAIPPRPIERFQLALSQQELTRLRYSLLFIVPGAVALLGIMVYWSRRS